jgi:hypothetical protein
MFAYHDLVVMPTIAVPSFAKGFGLGPAKINNTPIDPHPEWVFTWPFNLTGDPAVSVPCGWTRAGLPVGLQIAARRGQDGSGAAGGRRGRATNRTARAPGGAGETRQARREVTPRFCGGSVRSGEQLVPRPAE